MRKPIIIHRLNAALDNLHMDGLQAEYPNLQDYCQHCFGCDFPELRRVVFEDMDHLTRWMQNPLRVIPGCTDCGLTDSLVGLWELDYRLLHYGKAVSDPVLWDGSTADTLAVLRNIYRGNEPSWYSLAYVSPMLVPGNVRAVLASHDIFRGWWRVVLSCPKIDEEVVWKARLRTEAEAVRLAKRLEGKGWPIDRSGQIGWEAWVQRPDSTRYRLEPSL